MSSDEKLEMERYYHEQLSMLLESYRKAAEPILQKLFELRNLRPAPIVVTLEQAKGMGLLS